MSARPATPEKPPESSGGDASPPRPWYKNPYVWGAVAGLIFVPAIRPCLRHVPDPPPRSHTLPSFSLRDARGRTVTSRDLAGQVYVASFVAADCKRCGKLEAGLRGLRHSYEQMSVDNVKMVTFVYAPEGTERAALQRLERSYGARGKRWLLLGGPREQLDRLREGFRFPAAAKAARARDGGFAGRLAIVDQHGGVRGFYAIDKKEGFEEVLHRSLHVMLKAE